MKNGFITQLRNRLQSLADLSDCSTSESDLNLPLNQYVEATVILLQKVQPDMSRFEKDNNENNNKERILPARNVENHRKQTKSNEKTISLMTCSRTYPRGKMGGNVPFRPLFLGGGWRVPLHVGQKLIDTKSERLLQRYKRQYRKAHRNGERMAKIVHSCY